MSFVGCVGFVTFCWSVVSVVGCVSCCLCRHSIHGFVSMVNCISCIVDNSSSMLFFLSGQKHARTKPKGVQKAGKRIIYKKKWALSRFLFYFFLGVLSVLVYLLVYLQTRLSITRPRKPPKLRFKGFIVTNYIHGWINVRCGQKNTKKNRPKSRKTGDCPKLPV